MGNCLKWRPFVGESNEPFRLEYYDDEDIAKHALVQRRKMGHCNCFCIFKHFQKNKKMDISEYSHIPFGSIFIDDGNNFIRVSNPGEFICGKCGMLANAKLYKNSEGGYVMRSEKRIKWSIIPYSKEVQKSTHPLNPLSLKTRYVPNFGYILIPEYYSEYIFYLPEHTIIPPKTASGNISINSHFVVNTVEVGAVGVFQVRYSYGRPIDDYIAKDENGKVIKLGYMRLIRPFTYGGEYGTITLKQGFAEYKSFTDGRKTKVAAGCSLG